jgi:hypothetical protein
MEARYRNPGANTILMGEGQGGRLFCQDLQQNSTKLFTREIRDEKEVKGA